jgi:Protein of unknown function (DUF3429)
MQNTTSQAAQEAFTLPTSARALGYAGLLPFIASAAACWLTQGETKAFAQQALLAYGAVIVSFLGAVHWGIALAQRNAAPLPYVWSNVPALLAWTALLPPFTAGCVLLSVGLIICWWVDTQSLRAQAFGKSYMQLRTHLTMGAVLCVMAGRFAA